MDGPRLRSSNVDQYGSTSYYGDDSDTWDAGVTNATGPVNTAPPDVSGGAGSFLSALLPTLTNGINATLAAELNANFGQGVGAGLATVDANGNVTYKATPAQVVTPTQRAAAGAISSLPLVLLGVGALVILAVMLRK
jgi:hypothetical protein